MKKTITILMTTFCCLMGFSQSDKKNEIGMDCFSPIMTPSMRQYFNDDWILTPSTNYTRKYYSIGFSASYSRLIKGIKLGYKFGVVKRKVEESNKYDYNSVSNYFVDETFSYTQTHYVNSIFVTREETIKKLTLRLTFEIPFIYYGTGKNDYYNRTNSDYPTDFVITEKQEIASGYSTGLGASLGLGYELFKNTNLGIDLSGYILYSKFSKPSSGHRTETDILGNTGATNLDATYEVKNNYSQWGYSRLVPRIFIAVKF